MVTSGFDSKKFNQTVPIWNLLNAYIYFQFHLLNLGSLDYKQERGMFLNSFEILFPVLSIILMVGMTITNLLIQIILFFS